MDNPENTAASEKVVSRLVAIRWTEKIAKKGWAPIAHAFLDCYRRLPKPLTTTEAMVVIMLMRFKWDARNPFPSLKRLARMMGLGDTSIRNHVRSLEKKGYLDRIYRTGRSNAFDLSPLFEAIESTMERLEREESERIAQIQVFLADL